MANLDKANDMTLLDMRLPRQLEADETAEAVRRAFMAHTVKLWAGGHLDVALISMSDPLSNALRTARLKGLIRYGYEAILEKLESERIGIESLRERRGISHGDRVSRLLLFSSDGAERFYRHVEQLLQLHAPRLLGCRLDIGGIVLGRLMTGKETVIKAVMAEHKDVVSDIMRAIAASHETGRDID